MIAPGFWALLPGCSSGFVATPGGVEGGSEAADSADVADSAADSAEAEEEAPIVTEESGGDQPAAESDWIFDPRVIHQVALTIDNDSWTNLLYDPYAYTAADVTIDGVEAPDVGLRLRGKIGSFRPITGKPKFKIDFNQYHSGRRFYGLESLSLNNAVVDCSYLKERLGFEIVRQAGLAALRTTFADVTVNGVDYGLYVLLDAEDAVFVARHYADATGNLYDGKYDYDPATGSYTLLDFTDAVDDLFQLEEGTDVGLADIFAVTAAAASSYGSGDYEGGTGAVVDWETMHTMLAVEQWIGHNDGYALNTNNYRPYFDPGNAGKVDLLMWDLDYAFLEDNWWGLSWSYPRGTLAAGCFADATCRANQQAAAAALAAALDVTALEEQLSQWEALSETRAYTDPRRECAADSVASYRTWLHDWLPYRPAYMQAFWGY